MATAEHEGSLKGDVTWNHFFGDTEAEASMALAGSGVAHLKGGELGDMASVGLGVEAQVGRGRPWVSPTRVPMTATSRRTASPPMSASTSNVKQRT